jgi:hypothetical protein
MQWVQRMISRPPDKFVSVCGSITIEASAVTISSDLLPYVHAPAGYSRIQANASENTANTGFAGSLAALCKSAPPPLAFPAIPAYFAKPFQSNSLFPCPDHPSYDLYVASRHFERFYHETDHRP